MAYLLAPAAGALATLGFAPIDLWPLTVVALAGLLWMARDADWRRAARLGWLFGFAHFASGIYWVYIATHEYGGAAAWLALLLMAVLFAYLALYPALFLALVARLDLHRRAIGWAAVPAAWVLLELVRGWFYSGFPWLSLGYIALDTPAAKLAPLAGVHGIGALAMLMAYALYRIVAGGRRGRSFAAAALLAPAATALLPQAQSWTEPAGAPLRVALVQSDIRQGEKWLPQMRYEALSRHWRMTAEAWPADLVIWPEVAITQAYDAVEDSYLSDLRAEAQARAATVLVGIMVGTDGHYYNSVVAVGESEGRYDKRHLVPFGEYFPVPAFLRRMMNAVNLPYDDLAFGAHEQPPLLVRGQRAALGICFEDVFGAEAARAARGSAFLVNVTNDAWYNRSSAPWQHLQFSRMRALETGRWMARTANTGVSAFIDPDGGLRAQSGLFERRVVHGSVEPRRGDTPYMRWLDRPLWIGSALLLGVAAMWRRR
ncbi:MAG: apolipoprotein N-acyltransferase [Gammaproteobacteria bacterium]|nr:apolipoprotein N-acyltransferase [Gammaproteobacteria bacterium]